MSSRAYEDTFAAAPALQITTAACPRFVEFVERGVTSGDELLDAAQEYLAPLKAAGVDTLVLGCTHYPLLTGVISYVMGDRVTLVSSAEETAKDLYGALLRQKLQRRSEGPAAAGSPSGHTFLSTGDAESFARLARRFLGPEVLCVQQVDHVRERYPTGVIRRITPAMLAGAQDD